MESMELAPTFQMMESHTLDSGKRDLTTVYLDYPMLASFLSQLRNMMYSLHQLQSSSLWMGIPPETSSSNSTLMELMTLTSLQMIYPLICRDLQIRPTSIQLRGSLQMLPSTPSKLEPASLPISTRMVWLSKMKMSISPSRLLEFQTELSSQRKMQSTQL